MSGNGHRTVFFVSDSTGITAELTVFSKILICLAMVVGRVGPLTLAMVLLKPNRRSPVRYPSEDVLIG